MENEETKELAIPQTGEIMTLDSPLVVADGRGADIAITRQQFMSYYAKGANQEELFHCYQQTRATGLNPMIPGECYYFRTSDRPMSLFTGYPVYLRKAYAAGLEHLSFEFDRDEDPTICTVMLKIKGRDDFMWPTWFNEVSALNKSGQLNARWQKAPNQMFIKCSVVNTLRMSGLVDFSLPYILEEMGETAASGFRTLTENQLAAHNVPLELEEATLGEVSAMDHQIDMTPLHKIYRGKIAERELFPDDTTRKMWQSEIIGKASTADWDALDFNNATGEIESGRCEQWVQDNPPKPEPEPPQGAKTIGQQIAEKVERREAETAERMAEEKAMQKGGDPSLDGLPDVPEEHQEPPTTPTEPQEGQEQGEDNPEWDVKSKTRRRISELLVELTIYDSSRSQKFKKRVKPQLGGRWLLKMQDMTEAEGQAIITSLEEELAPQTNDDPQEPQVTSETVGEEITDDDPLNQGEPVEPSGEEHSKKQYDKMQELFNTLMPDKKYAMGTEEARDIIFGITGKRFKYLNEISEADISDVIHELQDKITDMEAKAEARAKEEANVPA